MALSVPVGLRPSLSVKSIRSAGVSWQSIGLGCRSMKTSERENFQKEKQISSSAASLARMSAGPVSAPECPDPVLDCFGNWCEPFAWYDPNSRSWKTWQTSFIEGWETFSESWPRAGFVSNGIAFRRETFGLRTTEIASGLLPTPTYGSNRSGQFHPMDGGARARARARARSLGILPTPTVSGNNNRVGASEKSGDGLFTAVRTEWHGPKIGATALVRFVEWMMGFPADWTRLSLSETPSRPTSRNSSAKR